MNPRIAKDDPRIKRIVDYLFAAGDWVRRDEVFAACDVDDRQGRSMIELTGGLVISRSSGGYKHTWHATDLELEHFMNEMRSREESHHRRRAEVAQAIRDRLTSNLAKPLELPL